MILSVNSDEFQEKEKRKIESLFLEKKKNILWVEISKIKS